MPRGTRGGAAGTDRPAERGDATVLLVGVPDAHSVTAALIDAGFSVRETATWTAAADLLPAVDCVVVGPALPDETAAGALSTTRDAAPAVPVVVYDDAIDAATALDAGAADYARPAAGPAALVARVDHVVDRRNRRRALERDRSILDSLLSHIPDSVYVKDERGRHVRVSDSIVGGDGEHIVNEEGKVHPAPEDVVGKTDFDLYHADGAAVSRDTEDEILATETPVEDVLQEYPPVEPHGWRVYTLTSKAPWYDQHGDLAGVVGVTRDVTKRKQYEERIERQNERLDRFACALSHDLRNPLNVAAGNLDLVRADVDHPRLADVAAALDRMDDLVQDVLTLARQGKSVTDPGPVSLAAVARDAWQNVDAPDATLAVDTEKTVRADRDRLQRLLENLFRNSVEHAGPTVAVTVSMDGFVVAVEDDGPGVPSDIQADVFDRGFTTSEDGNGFGLQIVDQIASAHDWTAAVTDAADGGARFELRGVRPVEADPESADCTDD